MSVMIESLPGRESARKRFQQAAVAICLNPSVSTCDAQSVASAIYTCARLNLIPDPALQLAAVVPFRDGKAGVRRATLIIMYKGLIELARRADPSIYLKAGTVYANDQYELVEGTDDRLIIRKRWWEIGKEEPGEAKFSYCVSRQTGGTSLLVVVSRQEGLAIANASKAGRRPGTPWHDHEDRMREKTCIKRAARLWSLDPERDDSRRLREAIDVDDRTEEAGTVPGTDLLGDLGIDEPPPDEIPTGASRIGTVAREVQEDVRPVEPPDDAAPALFDDDKPPF
jgi:recombination protein RecT